MKNICKNYLSFIKISIHLGIILQRGELIALGFHFILKFRWDNYVNQYLLVKFYFKINYLRNVRYKGQFLRKIILKRGYIWTLDLLYLLRGLVQKCSKYQVSYWPLIIFTCWGISISKWILLCRVNHPKSGTYLIGSFNMSRRVGRGLRYHDV